MMETRTEKREGARDYEKPVLRVIELAAEEVLAVGCKSNILTAAGSPTPPCMLRHCAGKGS